MSIISGRGSDKPKVMFIGQAPGKEESIRKKCFVGPAGQLLTQAISKYGLKPAYLTNLYKCFPPNDRDPNAKEIKEHAPLLIEEIDRLKPKIIVTLGNIPTRFILGKNCKITDVAGREFTETEYNGATVYPMLHPSFILRRPENLSTFESHCSKLQRMMKGGNHVKPKVTKVDPITAYKQLNETKDVVTFDYETTGITKSSTGKVRCVGFAFDETNLWVNASDPGFSKLMEWFLRSPLKKTCHNSSFEYRCSYENFKIKPKNLCYDTMAMHYLLDENSTHNLESVACSYLGVEPWDIHYEMEFQNYTYATVPIKMIGEYCGLDVRYTHELRKVLWEKMSDKLKNLHNKILIPLMKVSAIMEYNGIKFDSEWANKVDKEFEQEMEVSEINFRKTAKVKGELNMNSTVQIRKILVDKLHLPLMEKTEGGEVSVKESAVKKCEKEHKCVPHYLHWKKLQTLRNNFLQKFQRFTDHNSIIHASINPCFVVSGRLSITNPPLQAIPTEKKVRGMFNSRFEGGFIGSYDYSQLEMRLIANESNETKLLTAFEKGEDIHSLTANLIFGKGFTKDQRSIAKRINFGIVYGVTAHTLSNEFNLPYDYCERLIEKWYRAYPSVFKWMRRKRAHVNKYGQIESRFGRIRRLGDTSKLPDWKREAVERQAGNFPIQSMGVELTDMSMIKIQSFIIKSKLKSKLVLQVHDSIIVDIHPKELDVINERVPTIMSKEIPSRFPWLKVKLSVESETGERWDN